LVLLTLAMPLVEGAAQTPLDLTEPVRVTALAVALTPEGEVVGASADVSVSVATGGSGHVFIDTRPLAGTDMQGSARMAARVAAALTGFPLEEHDLFFVVRSESPIIAGPSAGGIMALAAAVALHNANDHEEPWALDPAVMATGTIGPDGTIGPVGGILEKARAAQHAGARLFLVPEGQGVVTTAVVQGGFLASTEPVDVSDYCEDELGITCLEVGTLEELLERATGQQIQHEDTGAPPSTADYVETMRPLSTELLEDAGAYRDVWDEVNRSDVSSTARDQMELVLGTAHSFAQDAARHFANEAYYSAASRAFSASIHGTQAKLLLEFFTGGRSLDALEAAV
ncbi:MAG: S16 family serine protease, partial [Myxococcota bacterium]